jgi:hypothetical protein
MFENALTIWFAVPSAIMAVISLLILLGRDPTAHGMIILAQFSFTATVIGLFLGIVAACLEHGWAGLLIIPCWIVGYFILGELVDG